MMVMFSIRFFAFDQTWCKRFFFVLIQNQKFCDFVDKQTGYKTKCMLTFPLVADKECLGVVTALNKIGSDTFTPEDEAVRMYTNACTFTRVHNGLLREL